MIEYYIIPSIFALSLKFILLFKAQKPNVNNFVLTFFFAILGANSIELYSFLFPGINSFSLILLTLYYVFVITALNSFLVFTLQSANLWNSYTIPLVLPTYLLPLCVLLLPGVGISSVESINYSLTRVPGPAYFMVQFGLIVPLISSLLITAICAILGKSADLRAKMLALLLSVLPMFLSILSVVVLMQVGIEINATIFFSLAVCLSLWIIMYTDNNQRLFYFMCHVPHTREQKVLRELCNYLQDPSLGLKPAKELLEAEMAGRALELSGNNLVQAAKILGVSRHTVRRKCQNKPSAEAAASP